MKRNYVLGLLFFLVAGQLSAQGFGNLLNKVKTKLEGGEALTEEQIGNGLKEALNLGVEEAVTFLSAEDGYYESVYKILLPEEAELVTRKLRAVPGFADAEQELILRINRGAEAAAKKASPIFVDAITGMTFTDALNILQGKDDAATRYLEDATYDQLYEAFQPVIIEALDEVNAREYWRSLTTAYNKLPLTKEVTTELDGYVTDKSLAGLFGLIEVKEKDIRTDVGSRTTELLQKVFARQD